MFPLALLGLTAAITAFALVLAGWDDRRERATLDAIHRGIGLGVRHWLARPVWCPKAQRWRDRRTSRFVKAPA